MPVSDISIITQQSTLIPLQYSPDATPAMSALTQAANTTQSLTALSFPSADIPAPSLPIRSSSAPVVSQPDRPPLSYYENASTSDLPLKTACSEIEKLVLSDNNATAIASGSAVNKGKKVSYLANVSSVYEQADTQQFATERSFPAAQRGRAQTRPELNRNSRQPSTSAAAPEATPGKYLFETIKFDIIYNTTSSAAEKRNELIKLCASTPKEVKVDISGANLQGVDLSGLIMNGFILDAVNFTGCMMNNMQLKGASMTGAILTNTTITNSDLSQANLTFAVMTNAEMKDAVMDNVKVRGANMQGTQLPANITLNLPDDYCQHGVLNARYFEQLAETVFSLGPQARRTRQSLYNQLYFNLQETGDEDFREANNAFLTEVQVRDTEPTPGGDGKGSIFRMAWDLIKP